MKKIEAIIRPGQLHDLKSELSAIGIEGLTVLEVGGFGRQRGHKEMFRGNEYDVDLMPKLMVVLVTKENLVDKVLDTFSKVCYTGEVGDGKVFISTVDEVMRIRTGEKGEGAL